VRGMTSSFSLEEKAGMRRIVNPFFGDVAMRSCCGGTAALRNVQQHPHGVTPPPDPACLTRSRATATNAQEEIERRFAANLAAAGTAALREKQHPAACGTEAQSREAQIPRNFQIFP
jgi:hypothetical protein